MLFQVLFFVFVFSSINSDEIQDYSVLDLEGEDVVWPVFNYWPVKRSALEVLKLRKRDTATGSIGTEGGQVPVPNNDNKQQEAVPPVKPMPVVNPAENKPDTKVPAKTSTPNVTATTLTPAPVTGNSTETKKNTTTVNSEEADTIQLSKPGVVKRGIIVFGGFALLAVAYYLFYRRKSNKNDNTNPHNVPDHMQFRYGVLQSNDRDNLELSRIPLTMESDEEEDDDLEIFDLEQKKKSLSYSNLKAQSEDGESFSIINENQQDNSDKDNLLLDIDDKDTETLINLTGHTSKSIL